MSKKEGKKKEGKEKGGDSKEDKGGKLNLSVLDRSSLVKYKKENNLPAPEIDTKGKKAVLEKPGRLYFLCVEAKEVSKKPGSWTVQVIFDGNKVYRSPLTSGNSWKFEDPPTFLNLPEEVKLITILMKEDGLVYSYKGEVRLEAESLHTGYPFDEWFTLRNKEGKSDDKIKGALHLRLLYVAKNKEVRGDEFKYPLHSLVLSNRLDLFKRKLDELSYDAYPEDDKKLTPLLLAAKEGKAGFVKLLVEKGAKILTEVDPEGRNAIHLAAYNGHPNIIHYLATQKGVTTAVLDKPDKEGLTPLHLAAEQNKPEACIALVQRGADPNITNPKGNTPLIHALLVQTGAHHAVKALVECGSDIYKKNKDGLCAWEISQRKDICHSSNNRASFMAATEVVDYREYEIGEVLPCKQRFIGKNLSTDWNTATQFIVTSDKETKVTFLGYSNTRTPECTKQVGFCVVKGKEPVHNMPSFQQEGIGFGTLKPFEVTIEPGWTYTLLTYCTNDELNGDFGICAFFQKGDKPLDCREGVDFKNHLIEKGSWKGKSAAGSANIKANPHFKLNVTGKSKDKAPVLVMLRQIQKDVSNIFAEGGYRIVPSKYYVGFYVLNENEEEINKCPHWLNSFDVYQFLSLTPGKPVIIVPTTRKEGETMEFELHAYSDVSIELESM